MSDKITNKEADFKELEVLKWSDLILFLFYFLSIGIGIGVIAEIYEIYAKVNIAETINTAYLAL